MDVLRSQITYCSLLLSVFKSLLKTFNEIVLVFLPVESKANILYVNINFNGNLFFGFGIYCGKVVPEPAFSRPFWAPALPKNVLSTFLDLVNDSRNTMVSSFLLG